MFTLKLFFTYFRKFIKEDFNFFIYLYTGLFLFLAIRYNYQHDYLSHLLGQYKGTLKGIGYGYLFFAVSYYGIAIPKLIVSHRLEMLRSISFYTRSSFLILAVSIGIFSDTIAWIRFGRNFWEWTMTRSEAYFVFLSISHFKFFSVWTFASVILFFFSRQYYRKPYLYGLRWKGFSLKIYIILFLLMVPILYFASLQDSFLITYPLLKIEKMDEVYELSVLELMIIFECIYALAFVGTEILFRGAFVLGLLDLIDHHGILPMASIYCFIHFNKPMLEAISSIFGGYILGVLAIATFNVVGGILIHIAVAWSMDFLSLYRKNIEVF